MLIKCGSCESENEAKNFCGDCGNVLAKADVEYESVLKEISTLAKSAVVEEAAPVAVETPAEEAPTEPVQEVQTEVAVVEALIKGQQAIMEKISSLVAEVSGVREGNVALAKATHLLMMKASVPPVQQASRVGAKSQLRAVEVTEKVLSGEAPAPEPELRGHALMAKCLVAREGGRLTAHDISSLNFWTNRNASIKDVASIDEDLANRISSAIS